MKTSWFLVFTLILFSGLVCLHGYLRDQMSPVKQLQSQVARMEKERRQADLRAQLALFQLSDYQQQVATLMPGALKGKGAEDSYALRQLASVVAEGDQMGIERASSLFEKAKQLFRDGEYEQSNEIFEDLIARYPESVHLVESHFLLAEGQYQIEDLEASVMTIEKMISLFPESELTGFSLLRLGRVFEKQDRLEDAADIYRAVLANFKQPEIVKQAESSLKAVAL